MPSAVKLSVLIPAVPARLGCPVLTDILGQADGRADVEILYLLDNKRRTAGAKRNALLDVAAGEYITFVDDDDSVAPDYISKILSGLAANPGIDVLTFGQECLHVASGYVERCRYGLTLDYRAARDRHPQDHSPLNTGWWEGKPAHTMVWRAAVIQSVDFPERNYGEDVAFVAGACQHARTEAALPDTLYYYRFDPTTSETRG